jgi:hypothetical protein
VALQLEGLRFALGKEENSDVHIATIVDTIRACARLLRELADLSQIHQERIRIVLNHLNVILPCLSRTLRDITTYYEDRTLTKTNRWRTMYHKMAEEAEGMTLPHRFKLYNYFLKSLRDVLIRYVTLSRTIFTICSTDKGHLDHPILISTDWRRHVSRSCTSASIEASVSACISHHLLDWSNFGVAAPPPNPVGPWLRSAALAVDGDPVSTLYCIILSTTSDTVNW